MDRTGGGRLGEHLLTADGKHLLACMGRSLRVYSASTGEYLFSLEHDGAVAAAVLHPVHAHQACFFSFSPLNMSICSVACCWISAHCHAPNLLNPCPAPAQVYVACEDEKLVLWDLSSGAALRTMPVPPGVRSMAVGRDGAFLSCTWRGDQAGRVLTYDLLKGNASEARTKVRPALSRGNYRLHVLGGRELSSASLDGIAPAIPSLPN